MTKDTWSTPLPQPITKVMTLKTLADVRKLMDGLGRSHSAKLPDRRLVE